MTPALRQRPRLASFHDGKGTSLDRWCSVVTAYHLSSVRRVLFFFTAVAVADLQAQARVGGIVTDSTRMRPLSGARVYAIPTATGGRLQALTDSAGRYRFDNLALGTWVLDVRHERRDSLGVEVPLVAVELREPGEVRADLGLPGTRQLITARCGPDVEVLGGGLITGIVRSARDGTPLAEATVHARWKTFLVEGGKLQRDSGRADVVTGSLGQYVFCGAPAGAGIAVLGMAGADSSGTLDITMPSDRVVVRDLYVAPRAWRTITLRDSVGDAAMVDALGGPARVEGRVVNERGLPVAGAQVNLSIAGRAATAGSSGAFALDSLPEGTHVLDLRAIGYAPIRVPVNLTAGAPVRETFGLTKITTIMDTVKVTAVRVYSGAQFAGFERRRRMGTGWFMGVEQLEAHAYTYPTDLVTMAPGVFVRGVGPDALILMRGNGGDLCIPTISVDGVRHVGDALDLQAIAPVSRIVGVEVYSRNAAIPVELPMAMNGCGVIAFWTGSRAAPGAKKP